MNVDKIIKCPQCQKITQYSVKNQFRPFCSERCKLIDLGEWANEEKLIPGSPIIEDENMPDSWE